MYKRFIAVIFVLLLNPLASVMAEPAASNVLIVELQTGGSGTGTSAQEFVEVYNPSDQPADITGWKLQYRSASKLPADTWPATSSTTVACATGSPADCKVMLAAHGLAVFATTAMTVPNSLNLNGGFADAGGQIRLVDNLGEVSDFIGYGTAADSETMPAPKPAGGESLKRRVDLNGVYVDTNNNSADFTLACGVPDPGNTQPILSGTAVGCPVFVVPGSDTPTDPAPSDDPEVAPEDSEATDTTDQPPAEEEPVASYLPVLINELLPDPAAPAQDETDEFIELYNPNQVSVGLKDYQIQSGTNYRYKYTLPDQAIAAGGYLVIVSEESGLALSNTGTTARILDPSGAVVDEIANYGKAAEGQSWAKNENGEWQWTTTPTPGVANTLTAPVAKAAIAKTPTTKKATAAKKTAAKPKVAAANKTNPTSQEDQVYEEPDGSTPINYWLLAGVGVLAAGYGVYEYRQGIGHGFRKIWALVRGKNAAS